MYGFPLTIYLLSGWLQTHYPGVDWFSHDAGHLLEMLFGLKASPHAGPFHILSYIFIGGGRHRRWPESRLALTRPATLESYSMMVYRHVDDREPTCSASRLENIGSRRVT